MSYPISIFLVTLLFITISPIHATFPTTDFNALLTPFTQTTASTGTTAWCTACAAFSTQCAMGCAGDNGGGGACPTDACPRVFTFTKQTNAIPIWNISVGTNANPYRAFSYIPICTTATACTESFVFSFSVKYTPMAGAAMPIFNNQADYLKLLFWGDGNNILGVKNGQLLGLPNGGVNDLVGSTTIGTGNAFNTPFPVNAWTNIAVKITYSNARATLAFFVNGTAMGSTTGSIGTATSGLQFGAYTWGGTFYNIQYTNMAFTAANVIPNPVVAAAGAPATTTAPATTAPAATTKPPTTATTTTAPAATTKPPTTATTATTKPPTTTTTTTGAPTATTTPTVVQPTNPPPLTKDTIALISPPSTIPQLNSFTVQMSYITHANRSLVVEVLQPFNSYMKWGSGYVNVGAGQGTVSVTVTITGIATPGIGYVLNYYAVDPTIYQMGTNPNAIKFLTASGTFSVSVQGTIYPTSTPTPPVAVNPGNPGTGGDPAQSLPTFPTPTDPPGVPNANGYTPPRNGATSSFLPGSILSLALILASMMLFL